MLPGIGGMGDDVSASIVWLENDLSHMALVRTESANNTTASHFFIDSSVCRMERRSLRSASIAVPKAISYGPVRMHFQVVLSCKASLNCADKIALSQAPGQRARARRLCSCGTLSPLAQARSEAGLPSPKPPGTMAFAANGNPSRAQRPREIEGIE